MATKENANGNHYQGINTNNLEFGGPKGALALMIWSHYILMYFW